MLPQEGDETFGKFSDLFSFGGILQFARFREGIIGIGKGHLIGQYQHADIAQKGAQGNQRAHSSERTGRGGQKGG